ncbi:MBL fold metallo-hydrolase [Chryseolinea sp. H1M3-3]|uniref:MBL fold metallo-hydrolase n=1 Tax=Chryseolinea sp. H1M3-3 TaxID=3034144 RepID=UPI0023EB0AC4|nr:MBL fold metallo-hydrolase [Chryseolinea sp. H1M3-3]
MEQELIQQYTSNLFAVAPGVWGRKETFVNLYFIQDHISGEWVMVDAGLKWSASNIKKIVNDIFGEGSKPSAIILTHGHFDHIGALDTLLKEWDVPVYAHPMELPYLTGQSAYPPPDPTVGGGMMSTLSFLYPTGPVDLREYIRPLPNDNTLPGLPEWKYIHTPGHSPGHISLFRERDKVLIAGDAFVTTKAESAISALTYMKHFSGPPKYFTCNWASAKLSVLKLAALDPEIVTTGHGNPMKGAEMRNQLGVLSRHFDELAVPEQGRYVNEPAVTNEEGVVFLPQAKETIPTLVKVFAASAVVFSLGFLIYSQARKQLA